MSNLSLIIISFLAFSEVASAQSTWSSDHNDIHQELMIPADFGFVDRLNSFSISNDNQIYSYDFSRPQGYIMSDSGFVPSLRPGPVTTRVVEVQNGRAVSSYVASKKEIEEIQAKVIEATAAGYEENIQSEIRRVVGEVERSLPKDEISFVKVTSKSNPHDILGCLRIVRSYFENGRYVLPSIKIMEGLGVASQAELQPVIAQVDNNTIEIGQFYIKKDLPAEERLVVKQQLLAWLHARLIFEYNEAYKYLVHVSTGAHERMYRNEYGFTEQIYNKKYNLDSVKVNESLLTANAHSFFEKLQKWDMSCVNLF